MRWCRLQSIRRIEITVAHGFNAQHDATPHDVVNQSNACACMACPMHETWNGRCMAHVVNEHRVCWTIKWAPCIANASLRAWPSNRSHCQTVIPHVVEERVSQRTRMLLPSLCSPPSYISRIRTCLDSLLYACETSRACVCGRSISYAKTEGLRSLLDHPNSSHTHARMPLLLIRPRSCQ